MDKGQCYLQRMYIELYIYIRILLIQNNNEQTGDKGIYKGFYRIVYLHQEFSSSISRTFVGDVSSFLDVQFLGLRDRPWKRWDSHVQYPVTFRITRPYPVLFPHMFLLRTCYSRSGLFQSQNFPRHLFH